jgi:hypothetical protein
MIVRASSIRSSKRFGWASQWGEIERELRRYEFKLKKGKPERSRRIK